MKLEISPMRPDEIGLVCDTWKASAFDSPVNAHYKARGSHGKGQYYARYNADVQRVLDSGALVLVAREENDPAFAYGWLAAGIVGDVCAIYYCYTKKSWRELGVMRDLRDRMLELCGEGPLVFVYCARSVRDSIFERWGFSFMSIDEVLGRERRSA